MFKKNAVVTNLSKQKPRRTRRVFSEKERARSRSNNGEKEKNLSERSCVIAAHR